MTVIPHTSTDKNSIIRSILSLDCICKGGVEIPVKKVEILSTLTTILYGIFHENVRFQVLMHFVLTKILLRLFCIFVGSIWKVSENILSIIKNGVEPLGLHHEIRTQ